MKASDLPKALGLGLGLLLSGCSAPGPGTTTALCSGLEHSWDQFVNTRDSETSSRGDILDARNALIVDLGTYSESDGVSDEISESLKVASMNFTSAWNASARGEQVMRQRYFWNGMDLVALRCEQDGQPVEFETRDVPIRPPTEQ